MEGKGGGKTGGKVGNQWSNNYGGKGNVVPHSGRDCYTCGGKGHIDDSCPHGLKTANEVEQAKVNAGTAAADSPTVLGQPLNCDSVEMESEIDAVPSPPTPQEVNEQWILPKHERKRVARRTSINLRSVYQAHECNKSCSHMNEWGDRIIKSFKQEKSWEAKCKEIGPIEMQSDDPEINAVPNASATHETIVVAVDSGAYNTVGPRHVRTHFPIKRAEASKKGKNYTAANGSTIKTVDSVS